jgi:uncharacterized protein YbjQ (UPF0145 family)
MILATTHTIEGKPVSVHLGIVAAEVIFGAMILKDLLAQGTDIIGGRSELYEKVFADARREALKELEAAAAQRGANAVLGVRIDYQVLGEKNGMLMATASGTAVAIPFTEEERRREDESVAAHYIDQGGQRRGPFSISQLRDLMNTGRLELDVVTYDEAGVEGKTVGALVPV